MYGGSSDISQARRALQVGAALCAGSLPAWMFTLSGVVGREVGLLRWIALILPAVLAGGMLLGLVYLSASGRARVRVGLASNTLLLVFGSLFLVALLALALPPILLADGPSVGEGASVGQRRAILKQRALGHPEAPRRREAARQFFLLTGNSIPYFDAEGRPAAYLPAAGDRRQRVMLGWMARRPGSRASERRLMAFIDLVLIALFFAALPLVNWMGKQASSAANGSVRAAAPGRAPPSLPDR